MTGGAATPAAGAGMLAQALGYAIGTVAVVTPELLGRPTPCRGWDLRTLLWHGCDSLAALDEGFTHGCVSLMGADEHAVSASPAEAFTARACSLLAAWTCRTRADVLIGGLPLSTGIVAAAGALEVAVHGWDIAQACGELHPIPAQLAGGLLEVAPLLVAGADRAPLFAAAVTVRAEASASDKLTAYLGRRPAPAGRGVWPSVASPN